MKTIKKIVIVLSSFVVYVVGYFIFRNFMGEIVSAAFLFIPVIVIALLGGSTLGLLSGLILSVFHFLYVYFTLNSDSNVFLAQSITGVVVLSGVGWILGYQRNIAKKIILLQQHATALKYGVEKAKDVVFITNTKGEIIYTNPAFESLYGYTKSDWLGKTPRILKSGETPVETYKELWQTITKGKPYDYRVVNKTKSGKLVKVDSSITPVISESGKLVGFLAIQRDITQLTQINTDRILKTEELQKTKNELQQRQIALINVLEDQKELETKLKNDKEQLNLIVNSMGEGLLVINKDYKIELINLKAQNLLGVDESVIGKKWSDVVQAYLGDEIIPFDQRTSVKVLNKKVSLVTTLDDNHYYFNRGGRKFPLTSVTTPFFEDEEVVGVIKVFTDATLEKEAKRVIEEQIRQKTSELKQEQEISSSILENTGEAVILSDSKGKVTYVNPAFNKVTSYTKDDVLGKEFSEVIKAHTLNGEPITPEEISDAAAVTADNHEMKVKITTKSGAIVAVVINAAPVYVDDNYIGIVRVVHDITQDVQLAQQKDDFFSIASHELRTPLTVISGNLDTVLNYGKSNLDPEDLAQIKDSVAAADRLAKLVSDFLNVSRLDQGRLKFEIEEVDMCELTGKVVEELQPLANDKQIQLTSVCDGDHPAIIMADSSLVREILTNLIGNSLKFTDSGSITLNHLLEGKMLKTLVADTGRGISDIDKGSLFSRFQQAKGRTLTRVAGGTGLGLYISKEFAKVMGGDLALEGSELGKGTTFSFVLPVKSGEKNEEKESES